MESLEKKPGIVFVGSPNVGKRTLVSRLISLDFEDASDSTPQELLHGWTIDTKYYSADVSIAVAHLHDGFSVTSIPTYSQLAALIMVFDMNDRSSLVALQDWASHTDLQRFEILLCIGNKVDLIPDHPVHSEYRRRLLKVGDLSASYDMDFSAYGISETEGSSLLCDDESSLEMRRSCSEWCIEHNVEFVEACGSNSDFDKCLSVDGDSQGVERLLGALSAHMWPGMVLKSGDKISQPPLPEADLSEEESDYELEYEKLSAGSAEPWDDTDDGWVSASGTIASSSTVRPVAQDDSNINGNVDGDNCDTKESLPSTSISALHKDVLQRVEARKPEESSHFDFDELGQLMAEISNIRENLRLMPDHQRRETAANMALKMASMFGGGSDDEEN